jgi:hypothetical protein
MGALTRRAALSMAGTLTMCAPPVGVLANTDPRIADLFREADALEAETAMMNAKPRTDEEMDAFVETRRDPFFAKVEALPETPAYAAIRARAVQLLYRDHPYVLATSDDTTDMRLAAQIVRSLATRAV